MSLKDGDRRGGGGFGGVGFGKRARCDQAGQYYVAKQGRSIRWNGWRDL